MKIPANSEHAAKCRPVTVSFMTWHGLMFADMHASGCQAAFRSTDSTRTEMADSSNTIGPIDADHGVPGLPISLPSCSIRAII